MKLKTKYPCEQCAEGTYMTVEQEWWCDKHLMYACQMERNCLCEKFERDGEQTDGGRQAVLDLVTASNEKNHKMREFIKKSDSIRNGEPFSDEVAPKKCHNENPDYADCDQFVCSNCGIELQDWHQVERDEDDGDITYHEYEFRFCPNCGARIVKEDKL